MKRFENFLTAIMPADFYWFNEPASFRLGRGLELITDDKTDFWQRTHYGFRPDNGHGLFTRLSGDFALKTHVTFDYQALYDQCGLLIRADAENWIKISAEMEGDGIGRLGSVVTNLGYSDWATQDISGSQKEMWYQVRRRGSDFLIESSLDGLAWVQMRITHMHRFPEEIEGGLYACSPIRGGFRSHFEFLEIGDNDWFYHDDEPTN